jgi:hypothetical protein
MEDTYMRWLLVALVVAWGCAGIPRRDRPPGVEAAEEMVAMLQSSNPATPGRPNGFHVDNLGVLYSDPETRATDTPTGWEWRLSGKGILVYHDHAQFSEAYRGTVEAVLLRTE